MSEKLHSFHCMYNVTYVKEQKFRLNSIVCIRIEIFRLYSIMLMYKCVKSRLLIEVKLVLIDSSCRVSPDESVSS